MTDYNKMELWQIAVIIKKEWNKVYYGAVPYIQAMETLSTIEDNYCMDNGRDIVARFLGNAGTWRGQIARDVKKHLNKLLKGTN